ncbi:hypothetical protein VF11_31830 [Nostoc linckia z14]|nr:hypothetical protein VF11_31830 [Nostoc linckia z14]
MPQPPDGVVTTLVPQPRKRKRKIKRKKGSVIFKLLDRGHGAWGRDGEMGRWGDGETRKCGECGGKDFFPILPHLPHLLLAQCPMPNAQCPMPNAQKIASNTRPVLKLAFRHT